MITYFGVLIPSSKFFSGRTFAINENPLKLQAFSPSNVLLYMVAMQGSAKRDNYHLSMIYRPSVIYSIIMA